MEGTCIKLLYSTFLACYINTADLRECGPEIKDFVPIYVMYKCDMSSGDFIEKFLEMTNSDPVKGCY